MGALSTTERNKLPDAAFALPGRRYPIHDEEHARDALARVAANGTPSEQMRVREAVRAKYPAMKVVTAARRPTQ